MPRRTFAEARAELDRQMLSPNDRRERELVLKKLLDRALVDIHQKQKGDHERLSDSIKELKTGLREVEDCLYDLEKGSRQQDISATEFRRRFDALQKERAALIQKSLAVQAQADRYAQIEEDPEEYLDDLYRRFPTVKPLFPW